jgi:hypothetical protein
VKTNSPSWRFWLGRWIQDLHDLPQNLYDCRLMHVQAGCQLFLKFSELPREFGSATQRFPHFQKRSNDKHAHLHGSSAIQNVCCHNRAVLSESVGTAAAASVA